MDRKIAWLGLVLTTAYAAIWVSFLSNRPHDFENLKLNEIGDFLAGAFGPLAILWLILGFFQQGIELRQNSQALLLQAEELRKSGEHQQVLAEVAREDLKATLEQMRLTHQRSEEEREAQKQLNEPRFILSGSGGAHSGKSRHKVQLLNAGMDAAEISLEMSNVEALTPTRVPRIGQGDSAVLEFTTPRQPDLPESVLTVNYKNRFGAPGMVKFRVFYTFADGNPHAQHVQLING